MIEAAVRGMNSADGSGVLAVSVLTSLDDDDLEQTGVALSMSDQVSRLAVLATMHGAEGMICSAHEPFLR